jgi:hypothetical protein
MGPLSHNMEQQQQDRHMLCPPGRVKLGDTFCLAGWRTPQSFAVADQPTGASHYLLDATTIYSAGEVVARLREIPLAGDTLSRSEDTQTDLHQKEM